MALICTSMSEAKSMVTSNRMPWQLGSKCLQDAVAATASFFCVLESASHARASSDGHDGAEKRNHTAK